MKQKTESVQGCTWKHRGQPVPPLWVGAQLGRRSMMPRSLHTHSSPPSKQPWGYNWVTGPTEGARDKGTGRSLRSHLQVGNYLALRGSVRKSHVVDEVLHGDAELSPWDWWLYPSPGTDGTRSVPRSRAHGTLRSVQLVSLKPWDETSVSVFGNSWFSSNKINDLVADYRPKREGNNHESVLILRCWLNG